MTWLDDINTRHKAATAGPWAVAYDSIRHGVTAADGQLIATIAGDDTDGQQDARNAMFFAATHTDIARLLDTIHQLQAENAELRRSLNQQLKIAA